VEDRTSECCMILWRDWAKRNSTVVRR